MDASRRGDDRRQEGVTQAVGRVAIPIFLNLRSSPLIEREIKVLMEQVRSSACDALNYVSNARARGGFVPTPTEDTRVLAL